MSSKTIFLMGAPSGRLQWDEEHLLKKAVPPFVDTSSTGTASQQPAESHTEYTSKWRVLRSDRTAQMRRSKEMQQHHSALFLDTTSLTAKMPRLRDDDNDNNVLLSRFYEHSLSILNTSTSSCSSFPDSEDWVNEDDEEEKENNTVQRPDSERIASWGAINQAVLFPQLRDLHNIKDIPNAAYLRSVIPQTLSVNLVVAVINVHPVKRLTARQTKQELEILELVVGDETRTGFGVTFWLPLPLSENNEGQTHHPHHPHHRSRPRNEDPNAEFRRKILDLRLRDILLMRNVGLSSFQDLVYGQSLRKGMTKVDLLYRPQFDSQGVQGVYSTLAIDTATRDDRLLCKVRRVRDWLMNYLGIVAPCGEHRNAHLLPPDTPDIEGH